MLDCDSSITKLVHLTIDCGDIGTISRPGLNPKVAHYLGYIVPLSLYMRVRIDKETGKLVATNSGERPSSLDLRFEGRDQPFQFMIPVGEMIIGTVTIE